MLDQLTNKDAMNFINKIGEPFQSLPHLPKGILNFLVMITPWFALLSAILGLLAGPLIGLFGTFASLFTLSPVYIITMVVAVVLTIANSVILLIAFTPLRKREQKGWVLLFWSEVIGIVSSAVAVFNGGSAIGTVIGALIGLYILFELRPMYKGMSSMSTPMKVTT